MSRTASIPVVVLSGALGAGKTTVLNRLLASGAARIGVVVNDFGSVGLDSWLLAGQVDEPVSIDGGCLCCLADPGQLDAALHRLTRARLGVQAVVVEASGLAEPRELARMVLASEVPEVRFGGVVEVVDALTAPSPDERGRWPLARHVRAASLVLLSKTEHLGERTAARVQELTELVRACSTAPVLPAPGGAAAPELLLGLGAEDSRARPPGEGQLELPWSELSAEPGEGHEHGVEHQEVTVVHDGGADPAALVDLFQDPPAGVVRAKGLVTVPGPRRERFVVHMVGGHLSIQRHRTVPRAGEPWTLLTVIGTGLDENAVERSLRACLLPVGARLEPQAAGGFRRWVPVED